ncbi:MAG: hypothetical protein OJF51_003058 [Nitrospira sp.]|nr:MAG: hypothetical protein OJF51_003058 [Nitrospira sp.]
MRSYSLKEVKYPRAHLNYEESQSRLKSTRFRFTESNGFRGFFFFCLVVSEGVAK